ncbi:carboxylate-amine ligase [Klebsiella pneumoniae]|uniref:Carboxylate-amine ligase n=1 Tax=Klebsiella pneumoniae TaxID=573 RepID=A0A2X1QMZ9_KLEPN|nr:carboxylate-amine ligase [Klebsiella pneumoniae]
MPLADFHRSDPFTLGIELELQVVNPPGYDLSQDASTLIADVQHQLTVGEAKHDITESMLEIATGVCRDISHAQIQLSAIQQAVQRAALRHHLQIYGGGSHPFHAWQRQQISDNPRYVKTVEHFGYLAQQATVFGQHVHVGCQSGDNAIYLLHGLSRFVPHFIALNGRLAVVRQHRQPLRLFAPQPLLLLSRQRSDAVGGRLAGVSSPVPPAELHQHDR